LYDFSNVVDLNVKYAFFVSPFDNQKARFMDEKCRLKKRCSIVW